MADLFSAPQKTNFLFLDILLELGPKAGGFVDAVLGVFIGSKDAGRAEQFGISEAVEHYLAVVLKTPHFLDLFRF